MYRQVNGRRMYISNRGPANGPPVVLLHHGVGSARSWKAQIPPLAQAGYRVIAYDRWGYGRSDPRPGLCLPGFETDLADLKDMLDQLGAGRVALVGHSDGGTMAFYFAALHPERVACLAAVSAHVYVEPKMQAGMEEIRQAYAQNPRFRKGLFRLHGEAYQKVFHNWSQGWQQEAHLEWDMRPTLAGVRCPVLVAQGIEDEDATPRHAEDIAQALPCAELWLEPGVGHMLPQDQPEVFNQRLIAFLQRNYSDGERNVQ